MKNIVFVLLWIAGNICSHAQAQSQFRGSVNVEKTAALQRIIGTKFFAAIPENYKPVGSKMCIERDQHTFLQVIEIPEISFKDSKAIFSKSLTDMGILKPEIRSLKYNNYDAIYFSGLSTKTNEATLGIVFGDENLTVMVLGVYPASDKQAMTELNALLYTSYYDQSVKVDPLERVNFTFDLGITGFTLAAHTGNRFVYTLNGASDMENEYDNISSFKIYSLKAADFAEAKEQFDYILRIDKMLKVLKQEEREININGNKAYTLLMELSYGGQASEIVYYVLMHKGETAVIYIATDNDHGKWLDKFKKTAESIQLQ